MDAIKGTPDTLDIQYLINGSEKAFAALYDHYWESLFNYVVGVIQDKDDAMDIVQDTFITLWKQRSSLNGVKSLNAYVHAIARHKSFRHIRDNIQKRDYLLSLVDYFINHEESPENLLISKEVQDLIDAEIDLLPPKMREVFLLSREEQLSYKEIADKLNISDRTVRNQISNSLRVLRQKIMSDRKLYVLLLLALTNGVVHDEASTAEGPPGSRSYTSEGW